MMIGNGINSDDDGDNVRIGQQPPTQHINNNNGRIIELSNAQHPDSTLMIQRQNSANSDEARISTSDSTDSGLGVIGYAMNGCTNQLLETVNESDINLLKSRQSDRSGSKTSNRTFRADMISSPTMSDIEPNVNHLLLRNSSLNEIELDGNDSILIDHHHHQQQQIVDHEIRPRFCHQCGTKYPNVMAKFCYECGSRRYETVT
ncbi:hypothetical protein BLA29_011358 [Euroglyphus maynei]|uniref:Zinc-ribbon domain-containing protein n=1 Tax=Euroglyphus maynei TaxID=6958 RepID=A0A1Y3B785_EURMA|nr:hypothetical protein BLA29_011358 [Euroglyphus maynei]